MFASRSSYLEFDLHLAVALQRQLIIVKMS